MRKPLILLTPDYEEEEERYTLKRSYAEAVLAAGGLPLVVPFGTPVAECLDLARGVVVTGGAFDIPPEAYGATRREGCGPAKEDRTRFEWELLRLALERDLPVLGVCGGMQLLNVVLGGTLIQDIPTEVPGALPHEQPPPKDRPFHEIRVEEGSLLAEATRGVEGPIAVNTTHHQAVARLGEGLVVTARAPDGVIEGIEAPGRPFVLGVQWHPEAMLRTAPWNLEIYRSLVRASSGRGV